MTLWGRLDCVWLAHGHLASELPGMSRDLNLAVPDINPALLTNTLQYYALTVQLEITLAISIWYHFSFVS